MIVDFLLNVVYTLGEWIVGLLPEWSLGHFVNDWGFTVSSLTRYIQLANYYLPLYETFVLAVSIAGVLLAWALVRFILRLIPGLG